MLRYSQCGNSQLQTSKRYRSTKPNSNQKTWLTIRNWCRFGMCEPSAVQPPHKSKPDRGWNLSFRYVQSQTASCILFYDIFTLGNVLSSTSTSYSPLVSCLAVLATFSPESPLPSPPPPDTKVRSQAGYVYLI